MKNFLIFSLVFFCTFSRITAQEDSSTFYATMSLQDAKELEKEYPQGIYIIEKKRNEAAVLLTEEGAHLIHERVVVHGPAFIYCKTKEEALQRLQADYKKTKAKKADFTITEDAIVSDAVENIITENIANQIQELEDYGTRFHTSRSARQSAEDLKSKWLKMADQYGRTDVSVRLVEHKSTSMPSVVMTIEGAQYPNQYVIVGGHLDSTSNRNSSNDAPGQMMMPLELLQLQKQQGQC